MSLVYLWFKMMNLLIVLFSPNSCKKIAEKPEIKRPNILVLISDDQRWDQLSCADHPLIPELKTPNMDRINDPQYAEIRNQLRRRYDHYLKSLKN